MRCRTTGCARCPGGPPPPASRLQPLGLPARHRVRSSARNEMQAGEYKIETYVEGAGASRLSLTNLSPPPRRMLLEALQRHSEAQQHRRAQLSPLLSPCTAVAVVLSVHSCCRCSHRRKIARWTPAVARYCHRRSSLPGLHPSGLEDSDPVASAARPKRVTLERCSHD